MGKQAEGDGVCVSQVLGAQGFPASSPIYKR